MRPKSERKEDGKTLNYTKGIRKKEDQEVQLAGIEQKHTNATIISTRSGKLLTNGRGGEKVRGRITQIGHSR